MFKTKKNKSVKKLSFLIGLAIGAILYVAYILDRYKLAKLIGEPSSSIFDKGSFMLLGPLVVMPIIYCVSIGIFIEKVKIKNRNLKLASVIMYGLVTFFVLGLITMAWVVSIAKPY